MLNNDRLFQALLTSIATSAGMDINSVAADLDVNSIDFIPFITHSSSAAQDKNGPNLWSVQLDVSIFLETGATPFTFVQDIYDGIHAWDSPAMTGIVSGVGAVVSIDQEINAFRRTQDGVKMLNKLVAQYVGSWQLTVRT